MTWFEIEQIARFIIDLEASLDNWTLNNMQMRSKLAELDMLSRKLRRMYDRCRGRSPNPVLCRAVDDLQEHIRRCNENLRERLIS